MEKKRLPDVPWHVGFAKKAENDPRRHKAWCIHSQNRMCMCRMSGCYLMNCIGSSHCRYYAETQYQWEAYLEEMKTEEDIADDKAKQYQRQKRQYVKKVLASGLYTHIYRFFP